jgi:hypothetical protein
LVESDPIEAISKWLCYSGVGKKIKDFGPECIFVIREGMYAYPIEDISALLNGEYAICADEFNDFQQNCRIPLALGRWHVHSF